MALATGTRIGPYEVITAIGAGGMGEVYRARDTRLDRTVAIKVLPELFASDTDRVARFQREAKALASLNHPNVAQIFGTEHSGNIHALAMEFVDGEDLAQRLERGAMPLDESLVIARQIADALEAAHEQGIIHRDLKPANVKIRPDGTAKVLDFGLAKAIEGDRHVARGFSRASQPRELANSPTFASPATEMGVILGTAPYMSPEQAKGKPVDRASDMWSFGALLFEMLTGRPAFAGETVTDVLAAIVTSDPDWTALPPKTPASVRRLLRRCLERDRRRRLADAGEARFQIEEAQSSPADRDSAPRTTAASFSRWIPWAIAALLAVSLVAIVSRTRKPPPGPDVAHYNLDLPPKATLSLALRPAIAISPNGRTVVFVASVGGIDRLYARSIDGFDSTAIEGTEGGSNPVISPDGRTVAFTTDTRLLKVPLGGGPVVTLADVSEPRGISWDVDDAIHYVPYVAGGVWRVPAAGGSPAQVTKPASAAERTHRWPQLLPGGAVMFTVGSPSSPDSYDDAAIVAQMPDGSRRTVLTAAAMARYAPTGHLIFARRGALFSVPFDAQRAEVKGTPAAMLQDVAGDATTGAANFAISASGTLAYISARDTQASLVPMWVDPAGRPEPAAIPAGMYSDLRLSPDRQQVAVTAIAGGGRDVWIHHFQRKTFTRMTVGGQNMTPIWSRDGSTVYYTKADSTHNTATIMRRPADGSREAEAVLTLPGRAVINDIAPDGRSLVVNIIGPETPTSTIAPTSARLALLELKKDARPVQIVDGTAEVFTARISPDFRWLAYVSRESGLPEVYVRPFGGGSGRWPVSTGGGEEPKWSGDGSRLFYRSSNVLMAVNVARGAATFESSPPAQVMAGIYNLRTETGITYDVDPKTDRFLMIRLAGDGAAAHSLRLIVNWSRRAGL
jgi:serine/threonine protein kinase/Tol biopolymer transport system component